MIEQAFRVVVDQCHGTMLDFEEALLNRMIEEGIQGVSKEIADMFRGGPSPEDVARLREVFAKVDDVSGN